jgi:hypothetical protein
MNFAVVLGQLCIDERFREEFFANGGKNARRVLARIPLPFTGEERRLLLSISKKGGHSPGLKQDFTALNEAIVNAGCGKGPCPIFAFTLSGR